MRTHNIVNVLRAHSFVRFISDQLSIVRTITRYKRKFECLCVCLHLCPCVFANSSSILLYGNFIQANLFFITLQNWTMCCVLFFLRWLKNEKLHKNLNSNLSKIKNANLIIIIKILCISIFFCSEITHKLLFDTKWNLNKINSSLFCTRLSQNTHAKSERERERKWETCVCFDIYACYLNANLHSWNTLCQFFYT